MLGYQQKKKKAKKAVKQKNTKKTEKPPTKAQKQKAEIEKCAKINMYFQVSDMDKGGSSNANAGNETIPGSDNPVMTSPTLVDHDRIVPGDNTDTNLQVSSATL